MNVQQWTTTSPSTTTAAKRRSATCAKGWTTRTSSPCSTCCKKESLTKSDREAIKKVARELLDKLTGGKLQIDHWREKATAQAQVKAEIIRHLFANLPAGAYDADEINPKAGAVLAHIYTAGLSRGARVLH